jgi:hypothetical protein
MLRLGCVIDGEILLRPVAGQGVSLDIRRNPFRLGGQAAPHLEGVRRRPAPGPMRVTHPEIKSAREEKRLPFGYGLVLALALSATYQRRSLRSGPC